VARSPYSSVVAENHQRADMRYLALVMLLALALAGCSSPPPAGAAKLAAKMPGCEQVTSTPDVLAQQEVSCTTPDGDWVWARSATFANMTGSSSG